MLSFRQVSRTQPLSPSGRGPGDCTDGWGSQSSPEPPRGFVTRSPASPAVPPAWSGHLQQRGSRGPTSGQALAAEAGASPYGGRRASRQDSRGFEIKCQRRRSARRKTPDPEEARARRAQGTRPRRTHTLRHRNYRTRAIQLPCFIYLQRNRGL